MNGSRLTSSANHFEARTARTPQQSAATQHLLIRAQLKSAVGEFEAAKLLLDDELETIGGTEEQHQHQIDTLLVRAMVAQQHGGYVSAENDLMTALAAAKKRYGDEHIMSVDLLDRLIQLEAPGQKREQRHCELLQERLPRARAVYGDFNSAIGEYKILGTMQAKRGEFAIAAESFLLSSAIERKLSGKTVLASTGGTLHEAGRSLLDNREFDRAIDVLREAMNISVRSRGRFHSQTISVVQDLARALRETGAERRSRKAIKCAAVRLGLWWSR